EALLLHLVEEVASEVEVRAAEDGQAHQVDALVRGRTCELLGRHPDALVDDLEARISRAQGDLLGAVRVAVEPRLANEELRAPPERVVERDDALAQRLERGRIAGHPTGPADARRSAVLTEGFAERSAPLAGRDPRLGGDDGRGHDVLAGLRGLAQHCERPL